MRFSYLAFLCLQCVNHVSECVDCGLKKNRNEKKKEYKIRKKKNSDSTKKEENLI